MFPRKTATNDVNWKINCVLIIASCPRHSKNVPATASLTGLGVRWRHISADTQSVIARNCLTIEREIVNSHANRLPGWTSRWLLFTDCQFRNFPRKPPFLVEYWNVCCYVENMNECRWLSLSVRQKIHESRDEMKRTRRWRELLQACCHAHNHQFSY